MIFLFRQPLLHFLLIGILLFGLQQYRGFAKTYELVSLDDATTQLLVDDFFTMTARMPAPDDIKKLVAKELDKRILFAEGLRLNFHRDDSVILQRLLRNANFLGFEGSDKEKIRAAFELGIHESDEVIRPYTSAYGECGSKSGDRHPDRRRVDGYLSGRLICLARTCALYL